MKDFWFAILVVIALVVVILDDVRVRAAIAGGDSDTSFVDRVIHVPAKPINADSLPAVLTLKSQLKRTQSALSAVRRAKAMVDSMYAAALDRSTDSTGIELPTAVLDTTIRRDSTAVDTVQLKYVFPPKNMFTDIHIGIAPTSVTVHDTTITNTVELPPSLWNQFKTALPYAAIGAAIGWLGHAIAK